MVKKINPNKLLEEADALGAKKGGFKAIFSSGPDYYGAACKYMEAANVLKLNKEFQRASAAFIKAAEMRKYDDDSYQQAQMLDKAGDCLGQVSALKAKDPCIDAAEILGNMGKFGQSARIYDKLGTQFEREADNVNAMEMYKKAADLYELDEFGKQKYISMLSKWADFASLSSPDHYDEAVKAYEKCGSLTMESAVSQFSAKRYYMKAVILYLVKDDAISADVKFEQFCQRDGRLHDSREGKLLQSVIKCVESRDAATLTTDLGDFDSISTLDSWHVHFFTILKLRLEPAGVSGTSTVFADSPYQQDNDDDLC